MFWRQQGQRFLLLHNQRDGRGKVLQRRLFACRAEGLKAVLTERGWAALKAEVLQHDLECSPDWKALRAKAQELYSEAPREDKSTADRVGELRRAAGRLRALLEKETDPEVLASVAPELGLIAELIGDAVQEGDESLSAIRRRLPPGRRRFEANDPAAQHYLCALDGSASELEQSEEWEEVVDVLRERLAACPNNDIALRLGTHLARLERWEEALDCFRRLPRALASRHYNEGAVLLQLGRDQEALQSLLLAMARERAHVRYQLQIRKAPGSLRPEAWRSSRDYWQRFQPLWKGRALEFLLQLGREVAPNLRITELEARAPRAYKVMRPWAQKLLLQRVDKKLNQGREYP